MILFAAKHGCQRSRIIRKLIQLFPLPLLIINKIKKISSFDLDGALLLELALILGEHLGIDLYVAVLLFFKSFRASAPSIKRQENIFTA